MSVSSLVRTLNGSVQHVHVLSVHSTPSVFPQVLIWAFGWAIERASASSEGIAF